MVVSYLYLLQYRIERKLIFLLMTSFGLWFIFFSYHYEKLHDMTPIEENITLKIHFIDYPAFDGNKMTSTVKALTGERLALTYYIQTKEEKAELASLIQPNTVCSISGILKTPDESRNPNAFDYRQYLMTQKIKYLITAESIQTCKQGEDSFYTKLMNYRKNSMAVINRYFPENVSPFVNALLFGYDDQMDDNTAEAYRQLGLSHLLAISGLHVTIISGAVYFILLRSGFTREIVRIMLLIFLPIYGIITGASPSVIRSVVMAWIILFLSKWKHVISSLDALALSFHAYVLFNPFILYHVGFQLSFIVTFGLLLSKTLLAKTAHAFSNGFWISCLSQLVALPILLHSFYEFSLLSILLNIVYVPLFSIIILPLCLITYLFLILLPHLGQVGANLLTAIFSIVNPFAEWVHQFKQFQMILGKPSTLLFLTFYLFFLAGFLLLEKFWMKRIKIVLAIILAPLILQFLVVKYSPVGEITFIDVGQGDSIFIRLPYHQGNYLIDTGGRVTFSAEDWQERKSNFDPGDDIVVPYLKSKGVTKIDKLILTHGDQDHIGSVKSIMENFRIGELLVGDSINKKDLELNTIHEAEKRGIMVKNILAGMKWKSGGFQFFVLSPQKSAIADNDASITLFSKLGGKTWLFTGDLEEKGEQEMMQRMGRLKADVLKVGHHGSETSTSETFLAEVRPSVAIISVGKDNRYGHPHREVINRLNQYNVNIYRTDYYGAITYNFLFDKGKWRTMKKTASCKDLRKKEK